MNALIKGSNGIWLIVNIRKVRTLNLQFNLAEDFNCDGMCPFVACNPGGGAGGKFLEATKQTTYKLPLLYFFRACLAQFDLAESAQ